MSRLRANVIKQTSAALSKFVGMVNYSGTLNAAAEAAAAQAAGVQLGQPELHKQHKRNENERRRSSASAATENPLYDEGKATATLGLANATTLKYGVRVMAIHVVEANQCDDSLQEMLTKGAKASADAKQLVLVEQGKAHARLVKSQSEADTMVKRAKGQAEAMVIEADGEAEAWVAEAHGILEAAKKLGDSPLTLYLERLRRAAEILTVPTS